MKTETDIIKDAVKCGIDDKKPIFLFGDDDTVMSFLSDLRNEMWDNEKPEKGFDKINFVNFRSHISYVDEFGPMEGTIGTVIREMASFTETLVVIFNDFFNTREDFQSQIFEMMLNRTAKGKNIPENIVILATDNRKTVTVPVAVMNKLSIHEIREK